jgi:photosystem II stability/assembly factor-like uncharacterized protein
MFSSIHPASGHLYYSTDMSFALIRSTDKGETWIPISNPIIGTAYYVAGDPKEPNTIYMNQIGASSHKNLEKASFKSSGIWKSTDDGDTWIHIFKSNDDNDNKNNIFGIHRSQSGVVDPENNQIIYWTGADKGVMRSKDGGYSWNDISSGLPKEKIKYLYAYTHCFALEIDYTSPLEHRKIYYPTNLGLYRMEEPDGKWTLVENGLPKDVCSDVVLCNDEILYAAFPDHGLYKSDNSGKSWKRKKKGLDNKNPFRVVATKNQPDIVYVATVRDKGIYGSQNGGDSFKLLTHRRFNARFNWPMNYRQHESVSGKYMFIDPNDPYTVYLDYNKKTHDGGQSWQHLGMIEVRRDRYRTTGLALLTEYRVAFDPKKPNIVWFGFSDTGLMLSEDYGESIINIISFHRGEVNQAAYWRDKFMISSGSCVSMAVDPVLSNTIYASICGKNANRRSEVGGMIIKSVDGGWNWQPIYEKHGLDDGIVRSVIIDPSSPTYNRSIYVASYANGVYKSIDDGKSFNRITPLDLFNGNPRLMWLEMAPSDPKTLYLGVGGTDGIRPIYIGPEAYPALEPGQYGGIFKTTDKGDSWIKLNKEREIPSVQDIAVHPFNRDIVYTAAYDENYLVPEDSGHPEWKEGGIYKTENGGDTWESIFKPPKNELMGNGQVSGICINPVAPEIIYAAVKFYGIYRTLDGGSTWEMLGKKSMDRRQRRYHSIDLNPHDPSEVWVAHFGTSFSKGIDYTARDYMNKKFQRANFIRNPGFENLDESGIPTYWGIEQPQVPNDEKPVVSVSSTRVKDGKYSVRFHLTEAYSYAPSRIPAVREQLRIESKDKSSNQKSKKRRRVTGETNSWIYQNIDPFFTTLMRGKRIVVEMDVFIKERNLPEYWNRGSEMGEIPRDPPQVYITEARDYNVHWMVAETSLEDLEPIHNIPASKMKGKWYHCSAVGSVSKDAQWLRVTLTGVGLRSGTMDLYTDNISLSIFE